VSDVNSTKSPARTTVYSVLIAIGLAICIPVAVAIWFILSGGPVANEYVCTPGEAPADLPGGGSSCFQEGSELPPGAAWQPAGNHPIP
jgi:hypothetical protein